MKKSTFTLSLLFSFALIFLSTNTAQAQIQCCCSDVGCFGGNAGFDCDTWCTLVGLGTNVGSNTPYADPAACTASGCGLVPVELTSFRVTMDKNNEVHLKWITEAEINNKGFEVQRMSGLDFSWETLGFVEGRGDSYETNSYSFSDAQPPLGISYYRLKQIDHDGEATHSLIESVNYDAAAVFSVWPTVARDYIFMMIHEDHKNADVIVQVRDLMGKKLIEQDTNTTALDIQSLSAGHYLISFYVNGQMYTQQFIKAD